MYFPPCGGHRPVGGRGRRGPLNSIGFFIAQQPGEGSGNTDDRQHDSKKRLAADMKNNKNLFDQEIKNLLLDPKVRHMKDFPQHGGTNTLSHVINVAEESFRLAEKLGWKIDEKVLARGAILHDYYLYDIKEQGLSPYNHGTSHPKKAVKNADRDFGLNSKEMNIIQGHMWPLTLFSPPRSKEAVLVCLADKYIATKEMVFNKYD
jgi:uncharacterized protein